MTTLLGLRHPEIEAVILAGDRQLTVKDDITGLPKRKHMERKLWIANSGFYCFGHSGLRNNRTEKFIQGLVEERYDVLKIVETGYFPELRELNIEIMGREVPKEEDMSFFLLATRFNNKPMLYTCFPLGKVQEINFWAAFGSGFLRIKEYIDALKVLSEARDYSKSNDKINLPYLIRAGLEAVRRAQGQDLYSSGLDILVCTPQGINDHSAELADNFGTKLARIQRLYR